MVTLFSDLDKTLVFSGKEGNVCVERHPNGREITYMTRSAKERLDELLNMHNFALIPCTLRSVEQASRIDFFKKCKIAICDNGGSIYVNGNLLQEWELIVEQNIDKEDVRQKVNKVKTYTLENGIELYMVKSNRDCFVSVIFYNKDTADKYADDIAKLFDPDKYHYHNQGKKIYFIPKWLNKKRAVDYCIHYTDLKSKDNCIITAGDSSVDVEFIDLGDKKIIPKHATFQNAEAIVTEAEGISAGEEIVSYVFSAVVAN